MHELELLDWILTPIYFVSIMGAGLVIKNRLIQKNSIYKYFIPGLYLKLLGAFLFCMIYSFYYEGGDTSAYFVSSKAIVNLFSKNASVAYSILTNHLTMENHHYFDSTTGLPEWYLYKRPEGFVTARYSVPFVFLGCKSFITSTMLISTFSYVGIWKLFQLFTTIYKQYTKELAIAILFIPSFVFWGSGIMKDTFMIGGVCWFTYNFHKIFIKREKIIINSVFLVVNIWMVISLKPYVVSALMLAMFFWLNSAYLNKVKSFIIKIILYPVIVVVVSSVGVYAFSNINSMLGDYGEIDTAIERAKITQQDLLRDEQYGSNNYDLGEIDGSISGLLKKAPLAIYTAIYRPSIIEIRSIGVLLSAIENTLLLVATLYILIKTKPLKILSILKSNPLMQYSVIFSLVLAFGVGLASANFGAMVRYKIPIIPFYFSTLFLMYRISRESLSNK